MLLWAFSVATAAVEDVLGRALKLLAISPTGPSTRSDIWALVAVTRQPDCMLLFFLTDNVFSNQIIARHQKYPPLFFFAIHVCVSVMLLKIHGKKPTPGSIAKYFHQSMGAGSVAVWLCVRVLESVCVYVFVCVHACVCVS